MWFIFAGLSKLAGLLSLRSHHLLIASSDKAEVSYLSFRRNGCVSLINLMVTERKQQVELKPVQQSPNCEWEIWRSRKAKYGIRLLFHATYTGDIKLLQLLTAKPWLMLTVCDAFASKESFEFCVVRELEGLTGMSGCCFRAQLLHLSCRL